MNRSDYMFAPLTFEQYEQIVAAGEMDGNTSPLHGQVNYDAAIAKAKAGKVDLRVLLAALLMEDHFGTDPNGGVALAKVYNFGGIKWAGQPGAFDSGILCPPNEGGTYAGFHDFGGFVAELIRTLNNQFCGPAFTAGDLARAWGIYIGGPNNPNMAGGQARVDQWQFYVRHYPPQGDAPVADGVYGEDLIAIARKHIGEAGSDGTLDPWNGAHPWAYWCEAFVEGVDTTSGLAVVRRSSAAEKCDAVLAQGLAQFSWPPEHGANCVWDRTFDPQGHICKWDADKGMFLTTIVNPSKVDYYFSAAWATAMRCWFRSPGVVAPYRAVQPPAPPPPTPPDFVLVDGNPFGEVPVPLWAWSRWDALNTMGTALDHPGAVNPEGFALVTYGYPRKPELVLPTGRRLMFFERAVMATEKGIAPWNVVTLSLREATPYVNY